jgi:signal transduction histidine kinase
MEQAMIKNKDTLAIVLFLVLVVLVWAGIAMLPGAQIAAMPQTKGGYDLTNSDLQNTVYTDVEHWDSWPEQLYSPANFEQGAVTDAPIQLSAADYERIQYATHRLTLKLPAGQLYGLYVRSSDFSMRMFIDGVEIGSVGTPGDTREATEPRVLEKTYFFTPKSETVEIIVQAANFVHSKSGCQPPELTIGTPENIQTYSGKLSAFRFAEIGCLLTAALYHLGLFLLNRKRKGALYFSICCALFTVMTKTAVLTFLTNYDFFFWIRVEYLTHFLVFMMLTLFIQTLFPRTYNKWVLRGYYALVGAYSLLTLLTDTTFFTGLLVYFEAASGLIIVYTIVRLAISLRGGGMKHLLAFLGTLAVALPGLLDILHYRGIELFDRFAGQYFIAPIGMMFFVFCYALVLSIEYAETERAWLAARDSERRLAAENAMLDSLSQIKSDYLANISHEMRTPLTIISGYAQQTEEEIEAGEVGEQSVKNLRVVQTEAHRLAELAGQVLYSEKNLQAVIGVVPTKPVEILERAAAICAPILAKNGNRLNTAYQPDCPAVAANLDMIVQVLVNLCSNAGRHTKNGVVSITAKQAGDFIAFTTQDTGSGIAAELLPRIFERGVSGDDATGLGLAICKDVIGQHGGTIKIDSKLGSGTSVTFTLPLCNN